MSIRFVPRQTITALVMTLAVSFAWMVERMEASQVAPTEGGDITGLVRSSNGAEAGVWVIAETDDLPTKFVKIVVTNDQGRFLLPDLPQATYDVWVRGYGLVDSTPVTGTPGQDLTLEAALASTLSEAAKTYPGNYWYSLIEPPAKSEFPGTGPDGNGISVGLRSQAAWVDRMKQGVRALSPAGNPDHAGGRFP